MRIAIGSDHAGYPLKIILSGALREWSHHVLDVGTDSPEPVDYPDFAEKVAKALMEGEAERAILICGSGVGASIAANKMPGIRAGLCHDTYSARQGVEHDSMNILVLGAWVIAEKLALELVNAFLGAQFSGEERHQRRLSKIARLESRYSKRRRGSALDF